MLKLLKSQLVPEVFGVEMIKSNDFNCSDVINRLEINLHVRFRASRQRRPVYKNVEEMSKCFGAFYLYPHASPVQN